MKTTHLALLAALLACLIVPACGDQAVPGTPTAPVVVKAVTVSGPSGSFIVGGTAQLKATATYSDGHQADVTTLSNWQSSNAAVASVNASGLATAVSPGQCVLQAMYVDVRGTVTVSAVADPCIFQGATGPQSFRWEASSTGKLQVPAPAGCAWTATAEADWVTLTGPFLTGTQTVGGVGPATVTYLVAEYEYSAGPPRIARVPLRGTTPGSGMPVEVTQWPNCTGSVVQTVSLSFDADGGRSALYSIVFDWPPNPCRWRVINNADWITISGVEPQLHMGDRDLRLVVAPNPGAAPRTATVYAPYYTFTVTQSGRPAPER